MRRMNADAERKWKRKTRSGRQLTRICHKAKELNYVDLLLTIPFEGCTVCVCVCVVTWFLVWTHDKPSNKCDMNEWIIHSTERLRMQTMRKKSLNLSDYIIKLLCRLDGVWFPDCHDVDIHWKDNIKPDHMLLSHTPPTLLWHTVIPTHNFWNTGAT